MTKKLFVGIDVSKGYADFCIVNESKVLMEPGFQLDDNLEGYQSLKTILTRYARELQYEQMYCACESTGGYEDCWLRELVRLSSELPVKVSRVNPKAVKGMSDAALKRTITDRVSAENVANYLMVFHEKLEYLSLDNPFKEARSHYRFISMLTKQKTQLGNQLEKLLYQHYNGLLDYCRAHMPVWLIRMLARYGSPQKVVKAGLSRLSSIEGLNQVRARTVIERSKNCRPVSDEIEFLLKQTSAEVLHKLDQIEENEKHLIALFKDHEQVKLLTTIPGVGVKTAVLMLIEIEDINRFDSAKKMSAFFGVNPQYKQSGDGSWAFHMSKKGRSVVRALLYTSVLCGTKYNPVIKQRYAAARAKGKNHYDAMAVGMHKLLRMIYGILKNKKEFNELVDKRNQEMATERQQNKKEEEKDVKIEKLKSKRRYQSEKLKNVPLSRRAAQKRKEMAGPNLTKT